jgi:hypothetical protein
MLPPPVLKITLFIGSIEKIPKRAAKKRPRPAAFWQMPCPRDNLDYSLSIRRVDGVNRAIQIQKNGKIQKSQPEAASRASRPLPKIL